MATLLRRVQALLGRSAYDLPSAVASSTNLASPQVEAARRAMGGQLAPPPVTRSRWYLADIESATNDADAGQLCAAAQLMRAARTDGRYIGVLDTLAQGVLRLPMEFRGDAEIAAALQPGHTTATDTSDPRSLFAEICPPQELALYLADGVELGVAIAELVPVAGRDYPVFVRLNPEYLQYVWSENQWYYRSVAGLVPIVPGDGRWVFHAPGGRVNPWHGGKWRAIATAYVRKTIASYAKDNWEQKLANAARIAESPQGANESQRLGWFQRVAAWGYNTVFDVPPGFSVKLLESNGRGWESFKETIQAQNEEFIIAIAGQTVTTDGGSGFSNAKVPQSIRKDIIQTTADNLAYTLNTQVLPQVIYQLYGTLDRTVVVSWRTEEPADNNSMAQAANMAGNAIKAITDALAAHKLVPDVVELCAAFQIPLMQPNELVAGTDELQANEVMDGSQVSSMLEVVTKVASGEITHANGKGILKVAFLLSDEEADSVLGVKGPDDNPGD